MRNLHLDLGRERYRRAEGRRDEEEGEDNRSEGGGEKIFGGPPEVSEVTELWLKNRGNYERRVRYFREISAPLYPGRNTMSNAAIFLGAERPNNISR